MSKQKSFSSKMNTQSSNHEMKNGMGMEQHAAGFGMPKTAKPQEMGNGRNQEMGNGHNDDGHSYGFTFSTDLATVQGMTRSITTSATATTTTSPQTLSIANSTFKTVVGLNDKNVQAVLDVVQTSTDNRFASTHVFNDKDGDGQYTETLDVQVATSATGLKQQKFTFNTDGTITADAPAVACPKNGLQPAQTPVLNKVTLDNVSYVTATMADAGGTGYHFNVFADSNADGTWTQIAQGETLNGVDANAAVSLVGVQPYLVAAATIVS